MSYSEENGQVILTMSREDYETLMMRIGSCLIFVHDKPEKLKRDLEFINRLNSGKPRYTPYQVEEKKS